MRKSLRDRIARLLATHQREIDDAVIAAVITLPDNTRGPKSDEPFPRISRTGNTAIITYKCGTPPTDAEVADLLAGVA